MSISRWTTGPRRSSPRRAPGTRGPRPAEERVVQAIKLARELGSKFDATDRTATPCCNRRGQETRHVVQYLADSGVALNARNLRGRRPWQTLAPLAPAKGSGEATFNDTTI